jgi:hypothetical protein
MATVNVRAARAIVAIGVEFIFSGRLLDRWTEFPQFRFRLTQENQI